MIAALLAAIALQSAPPAAGTAEPPPPDARSVPVERVFAFWPDYLAMPQEDRSAFSLAYVLSARTAPEHGGDWRFWIDLGDGPAPLLPDAAGRVTPPRSDLFETGRLITDAPEGGVAITMALSLSGAPRTDYAVADIEAALAQSHRAMRSLMGLRALMMPRLDAVRFDFEGPAPDAVWIDAEGTETPIETVYGESVMFRPGDRAYRSARSIRFGRAPVASVLEVSR